MRIVALSDIHANWTALQTVVPAVDRLRPDVVVVAGDIINRGPEPLPCLSAILELRDAKGWRVLKGNHEDYVLLVDRQPAAADGWMHDLFAHTRWTCERVRAHLPTLRALPDHLALHAPDGSEVRVVHASMQGNRSGLYEDMDDAVLAGLLAPAAPLTLVGHTHVPFVRPLHGALVVNSGAAGLPFDGDRRAAFAVLDWRAGGWHARIERVPYDYAAAERAFFSSGYTEQGGPMVPLVLDELRRARPRLGHWHRLYEAAVAAGDLTIEESIRLLLEQHP